MTQPKSLFAIISRSLVIYSILVSLIFLVGILSLYRMRLEEQRFDAADRINLLLQVSLENAMLKRDIDGLQEIVERLGKQSGIEAVMILNPAGEVRFASRPDLMARKFNFKTGELCTDCRWNGRDQIERNDILPSGTEGPLPVLRSVKSVANRAECAQCHGEKSENPVNGLLVVDHAAQDLRRNALIGSVVLVGAGLLVVLGLVAGIYRVLKVHVLTPVAQLTAASAEFAAGNLNRRVALTGGNEVVALGGAFNTMASQLQTTLAELHARERFVQGLLETLPDGVRVIDERFRIVMANGAYRRQVGQEDAAPPGTFCYHSSHRRSEPCVHTLVTCPIHVLRGKDTPLKFHARHVRANGEELSVEVNAARLTIDGPEGPRDLVIEVIRDLEAEMQVSHQQRLSELGQLATGVAHEIRNPLSSVAILLTDAEASLSKGKAFDLGPWIGLIKQEVGRCLAITDSLLKLGTPPDVELQLIVLNDVIGEVLSLLRFQAEEARVTVRLDMDDQVRVFGSDSDQRIVMINLIQNAFHAMPEGGTLSIAVRRGEEGMVATSFADTGVGIEPEDIPYIFMPFWSRRADGVRGTGLGLSICRAIIRKMSGDVRVSSTVGAGTTFTVLMPDADREAGVQA